MNYLELVNKAIFEAGVDLDDLTSGTFAAPASTKMYTHFKQWVADAWEDIQLDHNEWQFVSANAVVQINPRILVKNGNRATAPAAGYTYTSASGGVSFTIVSQSLLSGTWAGGTARAVLDISTIGGTGNFILLENYSELTPTPAANKFTFEFYGRYDLAAMVTDLGVAQVGSFSIQDEEGGSNTLTYVPWALWVEQGYELMYNIRGMPLFFTQTPDGQYDFYPRPERTYTLAFTYIKDQSVLSAYSDIPTGLPDKYHRAIMWLAVMYYANYDEKDNVWKRASLKYNKYMAAMERDLSQKATFGASIYDE